MKPRYIIGLLIIAAFFAVAFFSFDDSQIEYMDISQAKESGKICQIIGSWQKEHPYDYNAENNIFTFYMTDESNTSVKVIYKGMKPNNFEIAPTLVVKGKFDGKVLNASHIMTKCPSKYEGNIENAPHT